MPMSSGGGGLTLFDTVFAAVFLSFSCGCSLAWQGCQFYFIIYLFFFCTAPVFPEEISTHTRLIVGFSVRVDHTLLWECRK